MSLELIDEGIARCFSDTKMHVVKPCMNLLVCSYSLLLKAHQIPDESSKDWGSCGSKSQVVRKAVSAGCDFRQPLVQTPALAGIGPLW